MRFLYVVVVIAFIDTFIQLPIMTPYALSLGASETLAGVIVAMYSLSNVLGNIIGGYWVDRIGRKPIIIIGMVLVSFTLFFYPLAVTGEQLLWIRFVHGLFGGVLVPAAFALIGDWAKDTGNKKVMAFAGGSIGIAAIVGPALGGALAAAGQIIYVFILVAFVFLITAVLSIRYIKSMSPVQDKTPVDRQTLNAILTNRGVLKASTVAFTLMLSNGTLAFALPILVDQLQLTTVATGLLLSLFGISALFIFMTRLNVVFVRFTPFTLVFAGLGIIAFSMGILHFAFNLSMLIVAMIVYGIGFAFIFPSMNQMITNSTDETLRGKAYGLFYSCFSLGVVAGSSVSGIVQQSWGIPFIFCVGLIIINLIILRQLNKK
ncbi:MFS transporter [Alkalibacillus almallahensis]|uniref:MFS transporter n=1 Tax=Alkalibacillus almallahensis TaxID=1379154 RepID=UPI0014221B1F|nr:MFS transporter [Alkalibacillus almallahensis]NIK11222.1 MFS family permease [Alkalibacillus almallahensis]